MRKMRILAVDDNTVNLATLEQELQGEYEVIPMLSGKRAIRYLYCEKVDLILLDVQMPIMNGIETLQQIRNMDSGATVPVIFLTAMKDKDTVIQGSKLGIMDYVTKPFDSDDLKYRINFTFKRLGIYPIEDEEILKSLETVMTSLQDGKIKLALGKLDEIAGYQLTDEISGRIRNTRAKLEKGNEESAKKALERILRLLREKISPTVKESNNIILNDRELYVNLIRIQEHIENLKTREALEDSRKLLKYQLPDETKQSLQHVIDKLVIYDDEDAERIVCNLANATLKRTMPIEESAES